MWSIEYIFSGFTLTGSPLPICVFRVLFSTACLLKFAVETRRGYSHYFDRGSFLWTLDALSGRKPRLPVILYRTLYVAKIVAAAALLVGVAPQIGAAMLTLSFTVEARVYFKFHTALFALMASILILFTRI